MRKLNTTVEFVRRQKQGRGYAEAKAKYEAFWRDEAKPIIGKTAARKAHAWGWPEVIVLLLIAASGAACLIQIGALVLLIMG